MRCHEGCGILCPALRQMSMSENNQYSENPFKVEKCTVPKKVWYQISIDLMQMSEYRGYKYILSAQDYFSKWTEMVPIPNKKVSTIAKELYLMFTRYGCPRRIISDRGREFCNALSEKLFGFLGVEHHVTAPYHPQANGKFLLFRILITHVILKHNFILQI